MTRSSTLLEAQPPATRRLLASSVVAIAGAVLILVLIVLPAEYGIDATELGERLGLTTSRGPVRTLQIANVTGGNEAYREAEIPDFGQPAPLPSPTVHHDESEAEAEIKLIMFGWTTTTFPSSLPATTTT